MALLICILRDSFFAQHDRMIDTSLSSLRGLFQVFLLTPDLRPGLHSFTASRLGLLSGTPLKPASFHQLLVIANVEVVVTFLAEVGGLFPTQANIGLECATLGSVNKTS